MLLVYMDKDAEGYREKLLDPVFLKKMSCIQYFDATVPVTSYCYEALPAIVAH